MRYEGTLYRPPSEAGSYILQATIGCSWNHCTYCDMYRAKSFRVRTRDELIEDLARAARAYGSDVNKVFIADGDALVMEQERWLDLLSLLRATFPSLRRVSCYATAMNLNARSVSELTALRDAGLELLYIGPESGDDATLKAIAKGATHQEHRDAAAKAHTAGMKLSAIFLLGAGGTERSDIHARESARLATAMDPEFLSLLTLTVVPGTPLRRLEDTGRFTLPDMTGLLTELRTFVALVAPTSAIFRTNHASNYLPIGGRLPRDRDAILDIIDGALRGDVPLRSEHTRGL